MPYRRDYLCTHCGIIRRGEGFVPAQHYYQYGSKLEERIPYPEMLTQKQLTCCSQEMKVLGYEESVAAKQLSPDERIQWYLAGAHYARRGGKRKWSPVMDQSRCHGCHHGRET